MNPVLPGEALTLWLYLPALRGKNGLTERTTNLSEEYVALPRATHDRVVRALEGQPPLWTKAPPTVPGWWWVRVFGSDTPPFRFVAELDAEGLHAIQTWAAFTLNGGMEVKREHYEWCGPLRAPVRPA